MDEFNWDLFLDLVANQQIVPVIGSDLLLIKRDDQVVPLYEYFTQKLGAQLKIDPGTLNFREFVLENRDRSFFDTAIRRVFQNILNEGLLVTDHLHKLARITDFNFYLSTTFDAIFESVLQEERCQGDEKIVEIVYSYPHRASGGEPDLSSGAPVVYKILGTLDSPTCAITEEEILEYIFSLKNDNHSVHVLRDAVEQKNLLFLGCDFPNWLLRFFIRILTNERFVMSRTEKIIADNYVHKDSKLSLFLKHFRTQILSLSEEKLENPIRFIDEMYSKWIQYKMASIPKKYEGTVFLSFSHHDVSLIRPIRDEMAANGIDVWFDEKELGSGDNYDRIIKEKIRNCRLFIPFISEASVANLQSYVYSVEWDMAISRRKVREYDNDLQSFIKPVILDELEVTDARIPSAFRQLTIQKLNIQHLVERVKQELNLITHEG